MDIILSEIAGATGGVLRAGLPGTTVSSVSTDSRKAAAGSVFFALKGPNFDGHRFVEAVASNGARAAVVSSTEGLDLPVSFGLIEVKDTLKALGDFAAYYRSLFTMPVAAISGSAGKTSTKEMLSGILGVKRKVLKTQGNLNNLIGVPLTVFGLDKSHQAAVLELGISEMGEMERLVRICRPDIVLLTNIGRGHLKTLGSVEGVARAKGPLFTAAGPNATRIVNLDDPLITGLAGQARAITYSSRREADVMVLGHRGGPGFSIEAEYRVRGKDLLVRFGQAGVANVINGAAAMAASLAFGCGIDDMASGLEAYVPAHGRMEALDINGLIVLDDSYNANPESMRAALLTLKEAKGRKVAVLGDMLELGDASAAEHRAVGAFAAEAGAHTVIAIGEWSEELSRGAKEAGVRGRVLSFRDKKEALSALSAVVRQGDCVLVKGSRGVALEDIIEGLKAMEPAKKACV